LIHKVDFGIADLVKLKQSFEEIIKKLGLKEKQFFFLTEGRIIEEKLVSIDCFS